MPEWILELDKHLFLFINGLGYPYLDQFMIWMSDKYIWFPLYALLIYYLYRKNGWSFYQPVLALVVIIVITDRFTSGFMKPFFERYRPCHDPEINYLLTSLKHCGGLYGFASSHAANTFGLAFFFYIREKSTLGIALLIWASIVSYSRIYLGSHYPGDVVAGALVGLLAAWLIHFLLTYLQRHFRAG